MNWRIEKVKQCGCNNISEAKMISEEILRLSKLENFAEYHAQEEIQILSLELTKYLAIKEVI